MSEVTPAARAPRRWALVTLAALGLGLIAAPFIFQMFDRAPQGATMIEEFKPFMTDKRLTGFQDHIKVIDAGVREGDTAVAAALAGNHDAFAARFGNFAEFEQQWGAIEADMSDMLARIHGQLGNYEAVAALPPFDLFPWFFVIPGVLILVAVGIVAARRSAWRGARAALVALGVGLVLAPVAFQMFDRAPKGGRMMTAFETIETRKKVETIQGYFGTIAVGQGAVRLELIPALRDTGLSSREIASTFPGVTALDRRWAPILNDLTPMIGAMSDNVTRYEAVAALPPFPLFPWFFVLPGLMVAGFALAAGSLRQSPTRKSSMIRRILPGVSVLSLLVLLVLASAAPAGAAPLKGTFKLAPGKFSGGRASGSYFRMIFPGGSSRFFKNPDSSARDKTYTLITPGTAGGLVTGRYQSHPRRPFDGSGNSLAGAIIRPQKFAGIRFGVATLAKDPQSKKRVSAPSILVAGSRLTGNLSAFTAEWNKQYFNQGSPKPGSSAPKVSGSYNARTRHFVLQWRSLIKGGAFNGFTGLWRLEGTFRPGAGGAVAAAKKKRKCKYGRSKKTKRCKKRPRRRTPAKPAPAAPESRALSGTLALTPGGFVEGQGATGTYFRMVYPNGSRTSGPYFNNPDSTAPDDTHTLLAPGTDGGLVIGGFQESPTPAFTDNGHSLAGRIIKPQRFAGIDFGLSTAAKDPQTKLTVPKPSLTLSKGRLTGKIQALSAEWNKQFFNQGSPKPDGGSPGLTTAVKGTYDEATKAFELEWASSIVGGPFNGFTGVWHLQGVFKPLG